MKKKGWLAGGVAAAAGLIGAGTYFYSVAIKRAPKDFLEGSADLQDDFFEHQDVTDDWLRDYDAVEVNVQSTDGFRLHGFYINGDITLGKTVIIAHGYAGQAQDMKDWAQMYVKKGYNVLLPDAVVTGRVKGITSVLAIMNVKITSLGSIGLEDGDRTTVLFCTVCQWAVRQCS